MLIDGCAVPGGGGHVTHRTRAHYGLGPRPEARFATTAAVRAPFQKRLRILWNTIFHMMIHKTALLPSFWSRYLARCGRVQANTKCDVRPNKLFFGTAARAPLQPLLQTRILCAMLRDALLPPGMILTAASPCIARNRAVPVYLSTTAVIRACTSTA